MRPLPLFRRFQTLTGIVLLAATTAAAQERAPIFHVDKDACFGRVYDDKHLASHPQQKVTSLHVYHSAQGRPEAENWMPEARAQARAAFTQSQSVSVSAFVTFRDRKGRFYNGLGCQIDGDNKTRCSIECDGGQFTLEREPGDTVLLRNEGFVLIGGCESGLSRSESVYFSPGQDDKTFRLAPLAPDICRAEEQKTNPIRFGQGKPLRERFGATDAFCFGRDYDAAHLAKNPNQKVAAIRVARATPNKDMAESWPWAVELSVSLKLKRGGHRTARYTCSPTEASFECESDTRDSKGSEACTKFHLARAPGEDAILFNPREGLPIERACAEDFPTDDKTVRRTVSDDRSFRLSRLPVAACKLP